MDSCMSDGLWPQAMAPKPRKPVDPDSFYAFVYRLCREHKTTLAAVRGITGISSQAIERWKGKTAPKIATRAKLAKALKLPLSSLIRPGEEIEDYAPESTPSQPPPATVGASERYPSLVRFLQTTPHLEDERVHLEGVRFLFGDPGKSDVWADYLAAYRRARKAHESANAAMPVQPRK